MDAILHLPDEMRLRFECLKLASVHDETKNTWHLVNAARFLLRYIETGDALDKNAGGGAVIPDPAE